METELPDVENLSDEALKELFFELEEIVIEAEDENSFSHGHYNTTDPNFRFTEHQAKDLILEVEDELGRRGIDVYDE